MGLLGELQNYFVLPVSVRLLIFTIINGWGGRVAVFHNYHSHNKVSTEPRRRKSEQGKLKHKAHCSHHYSAIFLNKRPLDCCKPLVKSSEEINFDDACQTARCFMEEQII